MDQSRRRGWLGLFVIVPWLIGAVFQITSYFADDHSAAHQASALGTVLTHRFNHGEEYTYRYEVGVQNYQGTDVSNLVVPPGGQVRVYYDTTRPDRSSLVEFAVRREQDAGPLPLIVLGVGAFLIAMLFPGFRSFWGRRRNGG